MWNATVLFLMFFKWLALTSSETCMPCIAADLSHFPVAIFLNSRIGIKVKAIRAVVRAISIVVEAY